MHRTHHALALAMLAAAVPASAQSPTGVEFLNSGKVIAPGLPLSEGVRVGDTLYLSGVVVQTVAAAAEPSGTPEFLNSGKVVPTTLPFSDAVRVDDTLYLSGQIGIVPGGIREEARQTMENIRTSLEAHGYMMRDVVKCTVMLADIGEWGAFNEIYKEFFSAPYPARAAFGASGLALGASVEVECIAAYPR